MCKTLLKEIPFVNVCKIFVLPPKYLSLHYNLSENVGTDNCFCSKFGKGASFLFGRAIERGLCILNPCSWVSLNLCLGWRGRRGRCWGLNDIMLIKWQPGTFQCSIDMFPFFALLTCLPARAILLQLWQGSLPLPHGSNDCIRTIVLHGQSMSEP